MKHIHKTSLIVLIATFALFYLGACKKKDDPKPAVLEGDWKPDGSSYLTVYVGGIVAEKDTTGDEACEQDDIYEFDGTTKKLFIESGATKCDAEADVEEAGSYVLSADKKTLELTVEEEGQTITIPLSLSEFTDSKLKGKGTYTTTQMGVEVKVELDLRLKK